MNGDQNNYMVSVAEELMNIFSLVLTPGRFLVDVIPARESF